MRSNRVVLFAGLLLSVALAACAGPAWWDSNDGSDPNQAGRAAGPSELDLIDLAERAAATGADSDARARNLRLNRVTNDPSRFELRWDAPPIDGAWSEFRVYQSDVDFVDPAAAAEIARVTGTARSLPLTLPPGSGQVWLGVEGVRQSATSLETFTVDLSDTLLADTTERLVFMGDTAPLDGWTRQALYTAVFDGSAPPQAVLERLTPPSGELGPFVFDFAVAPDGFHVAWFGFVPGKPGNSIYVTALDGSEPIRRISGDLWVSPLQTADRVGFQWSPDSRQIAFASVDALSDRRIHVAPADGSAAPRAINGDVSLAYYWLGHDECEWSPDGRQIAFISIAGPGKAAAGLFVVASDGSSPPRRVSDNPPNSLVDMFDWSPDGRYLAYRHRSRLYVTEAKHPVVHRRASELGRSAEPEGWGADSRTLLVRYVDFPGGLSLSHVGENDVTVTELKTGIVDAVAWSRGRDKIAYAIRRQPDLLIAPSDVYVTQLADPAGTLRVGFARTPEDLRWSPNGEQVYFAAWRPDSGYEARFGYVAAPDVEDSYRRVLAPKFVGLSPREAAFSATSEFFAYSTVVQDFTIPVHAPMLFVERYGEEPRGWSRIAFQIPRELFTWGSPQLEWTMPGNP